jgi:transcriptional regulator with XRE-family HTH domain
MVSSNNFPVEEGKSPLRTLRELLGNISQEELARRLGVSVVTVSRWERGVTPATFTIPQMKALSRELKSVGYSVEDLPNDFGPFRLVKSVEA